MEDPEGFLKAHPKKAIFDEIQRVPKLLSQIQAHVDKTKRPGTYAISGSHNLLLLQSVSQSLAGRTSVRHLLPFSFSEIGNFLALNKLEEALFFGGYPPVLEFKERSHAWLDSYLQTYVERDVRLFRNVSNLSSFRRFLKLAAGRVGQLLMGKDHYPIWVDLERKWFLLDEKPAGMPYRAAYCIGDMVTQQLVEREGIKVSEITAWNFKTMLPRVTRALRNISN